MFTPNGWKPTPTSSTFGQAPNRCTERETFVFCYSGQLRKTAEEDCSSGLLSRTADTRPRTGIAGCDTRAECAGAEEAAKHRVELEAKCAQLRRDLDHATEAEQEARRNAVDAAMAADAGISRWHLWQVS